MSPHPGAPIDDGLLQTVVRIVARRRDPAVLTPAAIDDEAALERSHRPSLRLAVYGTLAPGEVNHGVVADLGGDWTRGWVRGHMGHRRWPVFTWDPAGPEHQVRVVCSAALPSAWRSIDDFEGDDYRRILVPVRWANGVTVANLYEATVPVVPGR